MTKNYVNKYNTINIKINAHTYIYIHTVIPYIRKKNMIRYFN